MTRDVACAHPLCLPGHRTGPTGHGLREHQLQELRATIDAADCDVVVAGTPIGLRRVVGTARAVRQARDEPRELAMRGSAPRNQ